MASTYVNNLRLNEMATGDGAGTWGTTTNTNLELIGEALGYGTEAITTNADTHTSTVADGSTDAARAMYIKYTGTLDSACTITIGPNTMKRVQFIENATSGSQNIIISQGSGANITIPPGDVKVVYLDGAGSGAAVVDAFASLSVVDLKVQDDLTVTDDMTVGGTLGVTGIVTLTDDLIIGDGKTIGSASDVDAMTIAANGQITLTQTLIGTALDISGDIDVDGTTNLDVVDIDGALTQDGGAVFNEASADVDFRVESNGNANMLFVDGGNDKVSIGGTSTDNFEFHVQGTSGSGDNTRFTYTNADANGCTLSIQKVTSSPADNDIIGILQFDSENDADEAVTYAQIRSLMTDVSDGSEDGILSFHTRGAGSFSERMRIDSSGNVGIGTSSFNATYDPRLQVTSAASDGTGGILIQNYLPTLTLEDISGGAAVSQIQQDQTNMLFKNNGSERMRISSSGQVSIGTTSTTAPLRVKVATDANFAVQNTSSTVQLQGINDAANAFATIDIAGNPIKFSANGSESMRIDSSGNVGIGLTNPSDYYANGLVVSSATEQGITLAATATNAANYLMFADGTTGDERYRGYLAYTHSGDELTLRSAGFTTFMTGGGTERMRIDSSGNVTIAKTSTGTLGTVGIDLRASGLGEFTTSNDACIAVNRLSTDGALVYFFQDTSVEGAISVSGSTVTYAGFSGNHETSGISTDTEIGTVCSTIDELDTYVSGSKEGQTRADHAKIKVSDTVGDTRVYGVLSSYSEKDNKPLVASVGIGSIKVTGACNGGDLLESNGDGTAKVQSDDIVRSKTIGKVTIGNSDTGVKLVSCVLYCG